MITTVTTVTTIAALGLTGVISIAASFLFGYTKSNGLAAASSNSYSLLG